mmetsp:Transcript_6374/g.18060  ORF Transcript_6374/g.18060 Transcript_6374/m.18060 type:complete len:84 (+) Transcript_6374:189-440(+)
MHIACCVVVCVCVCVFLMFFFICVYVCLVCDCCFRYFRLCFVVNFKCVAGLAVWVWMPFRSVFLGAHFSSFFKWSFAQFVFVV